MMQRFNNGLAWRVGVGLLLLLVAVPTQARAQCSGGPQQTFTAWDRHWTLNSGQTWPSGFFNQVDYAGGAWSSAFSTRGQSAGLTHGAGDITIVQSTTPGYGLADTTNNILYVDPSLLSPSLDQNFVYALILHELGHFMGFSQASQAGASVMSDTSPSSFRTNFTVCDNQQFNSYYGTPNNGECNPVYNPDGCSPIIINFALDRDLDLTEPDVWFDLHGVGQPVLLSWTPAGSDDGFLVLDRNRNGTIDNGMELFGDVTPVSWLSFGPRARHGFEALAFFDAPQNGGNGDGWISASDVVYNYLQIWTDANHDGVSQRRELRSLRERRLVAVSVVAKQSDRQDRVGNIYAYRAPALLMNAKGAIVRRFAYDVILTSR